MKDCPDPNVFKERFTAWLEKEHSCLRGELRGRPVTHPDIVVSGIPRLLDCYQDMLSKIHSGDFDK